MADAAHLLSNELSSPRVQSRYFWNSGTKWRKVLHEFCALSEKAIAYCSLLTSWDQSIKPLKQIHQENIWFPNTSAALMYPARSVSSVKVYNFSDLAEHVESWSFVLFPYSETISLYKCHYHGWFSRSYQRRSGRASLYGYFQCCSTWALTNSKP